MKPLSPSSLPQVFSKFQQLFPLRATTAPWSAAEPRRYPRRIDPRGLIKAFMIALVLGLPGLRAVAERGADLLGGCNHSALSHALRRMSSLIMIEYLLDLLASRRVAPTWCTS